MMRPPGLIGTLRVGYVRGYERSDLSVLMRYYHESHANVLITLLPLLHGRTGGGAPESGIRHHFHLGQHEPDGRIPDIDYMTGGKGQAGGGARMPAIPLPSGRSFGGMS